MVREIERLQGAMEEETSIILQMKTSPNLVLSLDAGLEKMGLQELMQARLSNHNLHTLVTYEGKK